MTASAGRSAIASSFSDRRAEVVEGVVDLALVALEGGRVLALLGHDLLEAEAADDPHASGRGEEPPRDDGAQLDELAGGNSLRAEVDPGAVDRDVAADADGMAPGPQHVAGGDHRRGQLVQADLPLIAPDLEVDVDDVVVGDGEAAQPVVDAEPPLLVGGLVVPDDPDPRVRARRAECPRRARALELGAPSGLVLLVALRDGDLIDGLALAERDLAVGAAEVAAERERDHLVDDEGAVLLDLDGDVRGRQGERLRRGVSGERERRCRRGGER